MSRSLDPLAVRRRLGRARWSAPMPFGPDGWAYRAVSVDGRQRSIIISCAEHDGVAWVHASIAGDTLPSYADLVELHRAVFGDGYAYQCFVPASAHVNIHPNALHLWGRLDGKPVLPEFALDGSI